MLGWMMLILACVLGGFSFRIARSADWHWTAAVAVGLAPVGLTYTMGFIGTLIAGAFVSALYKAIGQWSERTPWN